MEIPMKTCSKCKESKEAFNFGYSPTKNQYSSQCKECQKKGRKPWYTPIPGQDKNHPWRKDDALKTFKKKQIKNWESFDEKFDRWQRYG